MKQVILGGKTPIEGHTTDILKRFMLTNEQRQLCIRVIGSIASLPASSGNQPRHMAGGSYESHRTCSHGFLRRGHPEQSCRKNGPAMKEYTPPMEVGTRAWCDQNVPGDWIIE